MYNSTAYLPSSLAIANNKDNFEKSAWIELKNIYNQTDLSEQYASICEQHKQQKKWILLINPDENSLDQLATLNNIDTTKILCVNVKSTKINLQQIKKTLSKGNCSAVILSNAAFSTNEIAQLDASAQQGETQCIVLQRITTTNKILH